MSEGKALFMVEDSRGEPRLLGRMHDPLRRIFTNREGEDMDVVSVPCGSVTGLENRQLLKQVRHTRRVELSNLDGRTTRMC